MPQKIEPSTQNKTPAAITHDLAHFFTMPGAIAMNVAMFAGRFLRQRTLQPARDGIKQKIPAIRTEPKRGPLSPKGRNSRIEERTLRMPLPLAVNSRKLNQNPQVLLFLAGQLGWCWGEFFSHVRDGNKNKQWGP